MPITIGAKPAGDFSNPLKLLSDCHRRIERFLAVLVKIARDARGGPLTEQQATEWTRALDYFHHAAPRHTANEEESLFPRLRQIETAQVRDALDHIQELEYDHEKASEWHDRVEQLGRRRLAEGRLSAEETHSITDALERLSELYVHHIALEDQTVFPLAATALPAAGKTSMGAEMAKRRGLDPYRTLNH
jgi:hemerythrin-like domain-containing protein